MFDVDGEYTAYPSRCPFQSGPVCEGNATGRRTASYDRETLELEASWEREGEILVCPWCARKFDLGTANVSPATVSGPRRIRSR